MEGKRLNAGEKFVIKDSGRMAKYHGFKEGETVTLAQNITVTSQDGQNATFINEDNFGQVIFLRDLQPYEESQDG